MSQIFKNDSFAKQGKDSNPPNPLRGRGSKFPLFKGDQGDFDFHLPVKKEISD